MRLKSLALALLASSIPVVAAHADVLAPGHRGVRCEVLLEGLERHPDVMFVVGPLGFSAGVAYVQSGQAMPYQKFQKTRLYAIPRAKAVPEDELTYGWVVANAVAVSWHQFSQRHTVGEDAPEHRIRTVYRLGAREGRKLVVEGVKLERFGEDGELLEAPVVPPLDESDPNPPSGGDRRGSWAPRAEDAMIVLPALALVGLFGTTWFRRRRVG